MSFFQLAMPGIFQIFLKLFFVVFFSYKFYKWVPWIFTQTKSIINVYLGYSHKQKSFINWYLGYSHINKKKYYKWVPWIYTQTKKYYKLVPWI